MDSGDPSILGLYIDDSEGERFLLDLPNNPPNGVGAWNQTIFAGNEYHIIVEAQDANGWKDVDIIEVKLGGNSQALANYGTTLWFSPRNQSAWTNSNFITISENPDGTSKAKMRDMNGNVLIDPFVFQSSILTYRFHLIGACHLVAVLLTTKEYTHLRFRSQICVALKFSLNHQTVSHGAIVMICNSILEQT